MERWLLGTVAACILMSGKETVAVGRGQQKMINTNKQPLAPNPAPVTRRLACYLRKVVTEGKRLGDPVIKAAAAVLLSPVQSRRQNINESLGPTHCIEWAHGGKGRGAT